MTSVQQSLEASAASASINIAVIGGIRAQFMKIAAFQHAVRRWNAQSEVKINAIYINSGQHYDDDLAGLFFRELEIQFDIDLTGAYENQRPIDILGSMIIKLHDVFDQIDSQIQWVVVFGDANTTMAGAIAATRHKLPVVHVEAGLRSGNINSAEEQNRIVADHLAAVHFLSSKQDFQNLMREGLTHHVFWSGDLIYDLVNDLVPTLPLGYGHYASGGYVLATIHREENVQSDKIMCSIMSVLSNYSMKILFIAHPRTRRRLKELNLDNLNNIDYVDSLSYKDMLSAIKGCSFIVTDSGALQRESYYLSKRCLILQDHPFWPSLTRAGVHRLIEPEENSIRVGFDWMETILVSGEYPLVDDFGSGSAGATILHRLVELTLGLDPS